MPRYAATFVAASLLAVGISIISHAQTQTPSSVAPPQEPKPSRAQQLMGDIAPKLAELTDNVLSATSGSVRGLSKRDRSLVTVSALIA